MRHICGVSILVAGLLASALNAAWAQQEEHDAHHPKDGQTPATAKPEAQQSQAMAEKCMMMGEQMAAMKQKEAAMEKKLQGLLTEMNTSTGRAKTDAMAAAINELVAQHFQMREMHETMQKNMMAHMAEHTGTRREGGMANMSNCPMMKTDEAQDSADHETHH